MKQKRTLWVYNFILIILAAAIVAVALMIKPYLQEYHKAKKLQTEMQSVGYEKKDSSKGETEKTQIDFKKLVNVNADVVAWLEIPGTTVSYPVVRTQDNNYYLTHDIKKEYSQYGTLFIDKREYENPFKSKNLIIYGHNMGSYTDIMFSSLDDIYTGSSHSDTAYLYTENCTYKYTFISISEVTPTSDRFTTDFDSKKAFREWLKANGLSESENTDIKRVLTLATCNGNGSRRWIVTFRLSETLKK